MQSFIKNLVLYHANCTDGVAAAWCAHKALGNENTEYLPVQYGEPPPYDKMDKSTKVYILDFCYPKASLLNILNHCGFLTVLDHHPLCGDVIKQIHKEGNPAEIYGQKLDMYYDPERSGALMTFDYFHPEQGYPELLTYIDDYDRWQWKLQHTEAVSEYIRLRAPTIEWIGTLIQGFNVDGGRKIILDRGIALVKKKNNQVEQLAKSAIGYSYEGHPILGVNCPPEFSSKLGHKLAEQSASGCAFTWFRKSHDLVLYSVRSVDREECKNPQMYISARELCMNYGGGGHPNAGGFSSDKYPEQVFNLVGDDR